MFIEEGPCETVSTDITVGEIASTVELTEFHAADTLVKSSALVIQVRAPSLCI